MTLGVWRNALPAASCLPTLETSEKVANSAENFRVHCALSATAAPSSHSDQLSAEHASKCDRPSRVIFCGPITTAPGTSIAPSEAMTIREALQTAREFFSEYTLAKPYCEVIRDGETIERLVYLQEAFEVDGGISLEWNVDSDGAEDTEDSPEVIALVEGAIAALRQAHPQVNAFNIEYGIEA